MDILRFLVQAYAIIVLARIILEWIPVTYEHPLGKVRAVLRSLTEPVLRPLRAIIPTVQVGGAGLDLSPLVLLVGLQILAAAL